jgi:uncharacterized lipoprotein YehR (DUF1307 family)
MKSLYKFITVFFVLFSFYLTGCVDLEQKTKINADNSGTMKVHYWTKSSNLSMNTDLGGFGFTEDKARANYSSVNSEVTSAKVEKKDSDSTTHVNVELNFKDITKLPSAVAFKNVKVSYEKGSEGMDFKYVLLKDTAGHSGDNKLNFDFEFPSDVISTNGKKDGNKVSWTKTISDLKNDVEMTATVKSGKKCGLFGLELPIIVFTGLIFAGLKRRKQNKK